MTEQKLTKWACILDNNISINCILLPTMYVLIFTQGFFPSLSSGNSFCCHFYLQYKGAYLGKFYPKQCENNCSFQIIFFLNVRISPPCICAILYWCQSNFPSIVADNPRSGATDISGRKQHKAINREKYRDNQQELDTGTFQSVNVFQ